MLKMKLGYIWFGQTTLFVLYFVNYAFQLSTKRSQFFSGCIETAFDSQVFSDHDSGSGKLMRFTDEKNKIFYSNNLSFLEYIGHWIYSIH